MSEAEWVSVVEAARRLGWHTNTIRRLVRQGRIPYLRTSPRGSIRIPVHWIESHKETHP